MKAIISRRVTAITAALIFTVGSACATPNLNNNCASCHNDVIQNGMALMNFSYTTNLGAGSLKVYQVLRGQTVNLRFQVTNDYGGAYALSLRNLTAGGVAQSSNHMSYTGDASWTLRASGAAFTTAVTTSGPQLWSHNLLVLSNTPTDIYPVQVQMAGSFGPLWSQTEDFYIQVIAATVIPPFVITAPNYSNQQFSVSVSTVSGPTYFLEYRTDLAQVSWVLAAQTPGDGTIKVLSDLAATGAQRFYRVRAQ